MMIQRHLGGEWTNVNTRATVEALLQAGGAVRVESHIKALLLPHSSLISESQVVF